MSQQTPGGGFRTANEILSQGSQQLTSSSSSSSSSSDPFPTSLPSSYCSSSSASAQKSLTDPHPYRSQLWAAISSVDTTSSFCASANISDPGNDAGVGDQQPICTGIGMLPPGIEIENVGRLAFPLCIEQSRILLENAEHARFKSYGSSGELEFNTSKAYMVSGTKIKLHSKWRERFLPDIIKDVCKKLRIDNQKIGISANLHRLLFFSEGGFIRDPQDRDGKEFKELPPARRPFATCIIQLPSEYQGGGITISHRSIESTFNYGGIKSADTISYTVFYHDCDVSINALKSGRSVYLVFHLFRTIDSQIPLNPPPTPDEICELVYSSHEQWIHDTHFATPEKLFFRLKNAYTYENLKFSQLYPEDQRIIHFLDSFVKSGQSLFHLFLVNLQAANSFQLGQSYLSHGIVITKFVSADSGLNSLQMGIDILNETIVDQLPKFGDDSQSMICLWPTVKIVDFMLRKKGSVDEAMWYIQKKIEQNSSGSVNMDGNISMNTNNLQDDIAALFSYLKQQPNCEPLHVDKLLKMFENSLHHTKETIRLIESSGGIENASTAQCIYNAIEKHGWDALSEDIMSCVEVVNSNMVNLTEKLLEQFLLCLKWADTLNEKNQPVAAKVIGSSVINMMLTRADINGEGIKSSMEYVCGMKGYMSIFGTCIDTCMHMWIARSTCSQI